MLYTHPPVNVCQAVKFTATRNLNFLLGHIAGRFWQFCHKQDDVFCSQVGPQYATKAEAQADAHRYFAEYGY